MDLCEIFKVCILKHAEFNCAFRNNEGLFITLVIKFCVVCFKAILQTLACITLSAAVHNVLLPCVVQKGKVVPVLN
jgi:hypothetical protein